MNTRLVALLCFAAIAVGQDDKTLLSDSSPVKRELAAIRLTTRGAEHAVPELAECLVDASPRLRVVALRALATAGAAAKPAVPEMCRLFDDTNAQVRVQAYVAVVRLGEIELVASAIKRDKRILESFGLAHDKTLRSLLDCKSWHVRRWILGLDHVRRDATEDWIETIARLAATDPAGSVRRAAVNCLWKTRKLVTQEQFAACLDDPDPNIRSSALLGLTYMPQLNPAVIAAVERQLKHSNEWVRQRAVYALRDYENSRGKLESLRNDKSERVRGLTRAVLAGSGHWPEEGGDQIVAAALQCNFDPAYPWSTDNLVIGLGGGSQSLARAARDSLLASGSRAVASLVRAYQAAGNERLRGKIVDVLGILKQADALEPALRDKSIEVRRRAAANRAFLGNSDEATLRVLIDGLVEIRDEDAPEEKNAVNWATTSAGILAKLGNAAVPALNARRDKLNSTPPKAPQKLELRLGRIEDVLKQIRDR